MHVLAYPGVTSKIKANRTQRPPSTVRMAGIDPLAQLAQKSPMIKLMLALINIPSPTVNPEYPGSAQMHANIDKVRHMVQNAFEQLGVPKANFETDRFGSLIIRVPGAGRLKNRQPIMMMGHMDIVPGDIKNPLKPIKPQLVIEKTPQGDREFIATDGTTTLGADNKAGIAVIWDAIRQLKQSKADHAPFEILLAPDEETTNESLHKLDTSIFKSKSCLVVDNDTAFSVTTGCAGFTDVRIKISGLKGGHSGMSNPANNVSVVDVLHELRNRIGNRAVEMNPDFPEQPLISKNIYKFDIDQTPGNAIPTAGNLFFSLRSLKRKPQDKELARVRQAIRDVKKKFRHIEPDIKIEMVTSEGLPPFPGNAKSGLAKIAKQTALAMNHPEVRVEPIHGGTQGNLLAQKTNALGEKFSPIVIIGPTIKDEHAVTERVDWQTMVDVSNWLTQILCEESKRAKVLG